MSTQHEMALSRIRVMMKANAMSYAKQCIPEGAAPMQVRDTLTAFYGGMATMFNVLMLGAESFEELDQGKAPDAVHQLIKEEVDAITEGKFL